MEIELARHSGFCFGVKRAMKLAFQAANKTRLTRLTSAASASAASEGKVYSLGPLIHNPQAVDELGRRGVKVVEDLNQVEDGTLIIRSHGASPSVLAEVRRRGLEVVDATCPLVKKVQDLAKILGDEGYLVVIVGERDHYEVKSLLSFAGQGAVVLESPDEAKELGAGRRIGVLSQTTQSMENFKMVVGELVAGAEETKIFNTICEATRLRQQSTLNLAKRVDLMLVVGGYESANTRRLAQISEGTGVETHHIEIAREIDLPWLKGKEKVGVTAGASTPDWVIEEVMRKLHNNR
ncbi:4-hydroxy-3-methylbut-2-enyl diphosphate reductase [candidate division NPL-UPA2 bacterium]|nr:4-hydroxy-3-methylbut-2-enyl diphosphate reductase [candidate division NPL-UPA2 bacterium]